MLVDTGPLVAILSPNDAYHARCVDALKRLPRTQPLLTCWPVLTEAAWLVRNLQGGISKLLQLIDGRRVRIVSLADSSIPAIERLVTKYASLPMQLADAALLYLAEREGIDTVFTLDRRDFSVYRLESGRALTLLPSE